MSDGNLKTMSDGKIVSGVCLLVHIGTCVYVGSLSGRSFHYYQLLSWLFAQAWSIFLIAGPGPIHRIYLQRTQFFNLKILSSVTTRVSVTTRFHCFDKFKKALSFDKVLKFFWVSAWVDPSFWQFYRQKYVFVGDRWQWSSR